jgi:hypothetical protein
MIPFQYESTVIQQEFCSVKNELSFPFVDALLYTITSYCFDWDCRFSMDSFLTLKCIYILDIVFEILDYNFIAYIYHNFLKFNDSKSIIIFEWKLIKILLQYWCDLKIINNNFSFGDVQ